MINNEHIFIGKLRSNYHIYSECVRSHNIINIGFIDVNNANINIHDFAIDVSIKIYPFTADQNNIYVNRLIRGKSINIMMDNFNSKMIDGKYFEYSNGELYNIFNNYTLAYHPGSFCEAPSGHSSSFPPRLAKFNIIYSNFCITI